MSPSDRRSRPRRILAASHRATRRAATGIILLVVFVLAAAAGIWTVGGHHLADRVAAFVNSQVLDPDTRITIQDVSGFPLDHVIVTGIKLERESPEGWLTVAQVGRLRVSYDLWGLLHGRYLASRMDVDGMQVDIRDFPDGPLLPELRKRRSMGVGPSPVISVRKLTVENAAVRLGLPWRTIAVDSLRIEAGLALDRGALVELHRLDGWLGPGLGRLELTGGNVTVKNGVRLERLAGSIGGSPFSVDGPVAGEPLDLSVELSGFPLGRLGLFLGEDGLDPGSVQDVRGTVRAEGKQILFTADGDATWDTWVGHGLHARGTVAGDLLRLDDVGLEVDGTRVSRATVLVPLHARDVRIEGRVDDLRAPLLRNPSFDDVPGWVSGTASVHIRDRTDLLADTGLDVDLEKGTLYEIPFGAGRGRAQITHGDWKLDSLAVNLSDARLTGRGTAGADSLDLLFTYRGALAPWRGLVKQDDLSGRGQLRVWLHGPATRPVLEAKGDLGPVHVARIEAPLITLEEARGVVANGRRFSLRFAAPHGVKLGATPFSGADGALLVTDDAVEMDHLRLVRGDTTVTGSGTVHWEPTLTVRLTQAEAVLGERRFWMDHPGVLTRDGTRFSCDGILIHTPRGAVEVSGSYDTRTRDLSGHASLAGLDPSVLFPPESPPAVAVGKMTGTVDLQGTVPTLRGQADLGLREIDWKGGHLDTLAARIAVDDRSLVIDRLEPRLAGGSMVVAGRIDLPSSLPETFRGLQERTYPDSSRTTWNLDVDARRIVLGDWRFLVPAGERASGRIDAHLRVQGTSAHPNLTAVGRVAGLAWRGFEVDSLRVDAALDTGTVTARSLETWQGKKKLTLRGTAPLDLVLLPFHWDLPEREMNVELTAEDGNLESLKLTPWIKEATGDLRAEVRARGTPRHPLLEGEATVENAQVSLDERDEVISNLSAHFRFDRDLIIVEDAKGLVSLPWVGPKTPGGWATATGTYRLGADEAHSYQLQIKCDRILVGDEGTYAARVSGEVTLAPLLASDGRVYPMARGKIEAERVEYGGSLQPQDVGPLEPPSILYDVTIDAPDRIYLSTEGVEAEMGGELTVQQEVSRQVIVGKLDIHRGTYQFFEKTFQVTDGTLTWQNPETRLPDLDITAQTKQAGYLVTVVLTGRADQPTVTFSASSLASGQDAGLSQEQILQLLIAGSFGINAQALGLNSQTTGTATPGTETTPSGTPGTGQFVLGGVGFLTAPLQRELVDKFARQLGIPVDEITIQNESVNGTQETQLGVTSYPVPEVGLTYMQGLNSTFEQSLAVEYRLRRAVFLRGAVIRLPKESKQEYNLDLKFRREY